MKGICEYRKLITPELFDYVLNKSPDEDELKLDDSITKSDPPEPNKKDKEKKKKKAQTYEKVF